MLKRWMLGVVSLCLSGLVMASQEASQIEEMIASGEAYLTQNIMEKFEELESIDIEFLLGTWKGGKFDGGKSPDPIKWYGKRFDSRDQVEPLLVYGEDGSIQVFDKLGAASMRNIEFKGKVSASLIYDKQPIMDYFRKVNDDVVIGYGEVKGMPEKNFFFHLTRQK